MKNSMRFTLSCLPRPSFGLLLVVLSLSCPGGSATAAPRMPVGAFLRHPAPTVDALNRQLRTDPLVCTRYARLYKMSPEMVKQAFAHMRLATLPEDRILAVHYVYPGEKIKYKLRRVKKGTPVYLLSDGSPALVRVCGNPVKAVLGEAKNYPGPVTGKPSLIPEFVENEALTPIPAAPRIAAGPLRAAAPEEEIGPIPVTDVLPPGNLPPVPPGLKPAEIAPVATSTISHFANNTGLLLLPALGGLAALLGGGGNSSSPESAAAPPVVTPPIVTPPIVTPPILPPPVLTPPVVTPPVTTPPVVKPPVVVPPITSTGGPSQTPEPGAIVGSLALLTAGVLLARRRK
jgi:hypothetical protein